MSFDVNEWLVVCSGGEYWIVRGADPLPLFCDVLDGFRLYRDAKSFLDQMLREHTPNGREE